MVPCLIADPLVLMMRGFVAYLLVIGCGPALIFNTNDSAISFVFTDTVDSVAIGKKANLAEQVES
jgi:hypothetical protein